MFAPYLARVTLRCFALATVVVVSAFDAGAQCPDGSAPPCASPRLRDAPRPIDQNRIAVIPFRVTTSDTLLGEGFAELLASEFTGQGMPRAVDMGSVIQAWQRAGGSHRKPLTRAQSIAIARTLGAGLVTEGSIVGLGRQILVTATVLRVSDGAPQGDQAKVTAPADSVDAALRKAVAVLMGKGAEVKRTADATRYTDSPEAMRAYLEGMSLWRRGRIREASQAWDRAIALDSSFGRALYRRNVATSWGLPGGPSLRRVWEHRDRLSDDEKIVLLGRTGADYPRPRTVDQAFSDRDFAVARLPDNPDALYNAGDLWYHMGSSVQPSQALTRARAYFERAAAVDSQATVLQHLFEIALRTGDTAGMRVTARALSTTEGDNRWIAPMIVAAATHDDATLRQAIKGVELQGNFVLALGAVSRVLRWQDHLNLRARLLPLVPDSLRPLASAVSGMTAAIYGRPEDARAAFRGATGRAGGLVVTAVLGMALARTAEGLDVQSTLAYLRDSTPGDSIAVTRKRCFLTLVALRNGQPVPIDTVGFGRYARHCAFAISVLRIPLDSGVASERELLRADSTLRGMILNQSPMLEGYEARILADAWEKFGNPRRALSAIRYRQMGLSPLADAWWNLRTEGRLAAAVGDTTGAINAYRAWLDLMRDAEPPLFPKRDSVRAELAKLFKGPIP